MDGSGCGLVLVIFAIFIPSVELSGHSNCSESQLHLTVCQNQFNENTVPICPEVIKLKTCLANCASVKHCPSQDAKILYESLVKKMNYYPQCLAHCKVGKKECSEEYVNDCYQQYNHNATEICPEVKKLRMCISELTGCHAMKHPKFVLSRDILEKHRKCFFVNYTRILAVLRKKEPIPNNRTCTERLIDECQDQFKESPAPVCEKVLQLRACIATCLNVKTWQSWAAKVTYQSLVKKIKDCGLVLTITTPKGVSTSKSKSKTKVNTEAQPSPQSKLEQQTEQLPYTFVVVATVCTCMFLVVLVVFSIVRHTTLSKRQRNSSVESGSMRIRIRSHTPRDRDRDRDRNRTRRHRHHRSHRGRSAAPGGAVRQTVSGFFEGNVAPPPYSAVLDDNESVRAGDPPPPYRPPSGLGIGVIV
ncbi:uncharacterized protein [Montipora capricornis]|uniref:uncharacterized protein n=1 Tax=Montipora capricornis TaxID=246305 RepID=UPI0035F157B8